MAITACIALSAVAVHAQSTASDLFISEYVEGSSNNKYIEIYNGTGAAVNLADYQLRNYSNGSLTPSFTNVLTGTLASGATIVYKNSAATLYGGTATNQTAVVFNGDDAVVLWKVSTNSPVDIFGVIGNDPGTSWTGTDGTTNFTTVDRTLRRKCDVRGGVTTNPATFATLATEWEQFNTDDVTNLGAHTTCYAPAFCLSDLILSEYIEGSSNNKCIEIYNGTGTSVDLAAGGYRLKVYFNGSASPATDIALGGIVAHDDVYVICNPQSAAAFLSVADATHGGIQFNGDDAVVLEKGAGVLVDIFGRIGEDPGAAWTAGAVSTVDRTLQRMTNITAGVTTNPVAGFPTLATQWNDLGLNFSADLGQHTVDCGGPTAPPTVSLGNDQYICPGPVVLDGGTNATSYLWSTGATTRFITVSTPGVYSVTATNAGGTTSDAVAVNHVSAPILGLSPLGATICNGDSQLLTATAFTGGLFISEYVEGSGSNKAVELYNGTGAAIDLAAGNYSLEVSFNGGTSMRNIPLTGVVAHNGTYIVGDALAAAAITSISNQLVSGGLWNGDDAVYLKQGAAIIDIFGVIGNDPGAQWWAGPGTTGIRTSDRTLLRNCNVWGGIGVNPTGTGVNAFNTLSTEWTELATDDFSDLGTFTNCPGLLWSNGATSASISVAPATSTSYDMSATNLYGCSVAAQAVVTVSSPVVATAGATTLCPGTGTQVCAEVRSNDLIISEYVEGSGFTKYIEIYNGTGAAVNLAGYELRAYHNGATMPTFVNDLSVAGTLAPGATLVAANSQATTYAGDVEVYFGVNHNGNDAIALYNATTGTYVDIFGRIGEDPGVAWVSGANQTADRTLRRNSTVADGVKANPLSGFPTLGTEWSAFGINDVSGLGNHALSPAGTFVWSDGQTGACITVTPDATTTYTVTYTDVNGCTASSAVTVATFAAPAVDAGTDQVVYLGYAPAACVTLAATASSGTAPYTYQWSDGATTATTTACPTAATTYTVSITDANSCTATDEVAVCVVDVRCGNGNNKVLVCQVPPGNPGNAHTVCIAPAAVATHLSNGSYLGACGTTTACASGKSTATEGAAALGEATTLQAFPNPFATSATIRFTTAVGGAASLEVFDLNGIRVAALFDGGTDAGTAYAFELNGNGLADGIYFVRLTTQDGIKMHKLVLAR